ncbi:MAG: helix-turn-helix transcriptional regulator [Clostridia bacterium]|nr:helix-turn-helix transcriptional regulator [Clostridia bacterium]
MFSEKLRSIRQKNNMTQKEFARYLGISPSTISMYERGERMPTSTILRKISASSEISMDYFVNQEPVSSDVMAIIQSTCDIIRDKDNLTYKAKPVDAEKIKKLTDSILLISELILDEHIVKLRR